MKASIAGSLGLVLSIAGCAQDAASYQTRLNQPLKKELEEIYARDQGVRQNARAVVEKYGQKSPQVDSLGRAMQRTDSLNLRRVTALIDRYGWLGKSLVGPDGSVTAFLVIQHSNLPTMQQYAPMMRAAAAKGELEYASLALVEDRILTYQNKSQIYGSQLRTNPITGKMELFPIEDEAHVDERRAKMGLGALTEYAQSFGLDYKPKKGR
ncbi:DUF6624 domain-containing protein [Hymenobacter cellulosivorans]|uniref:DUF4252 domain-containing protein n=1 Tax=Hymenobacter cellulosivorans TaxID=2932249 RepID=A0ABY4FBR8_9BACT|nr:DUF6624 domain-containing protein [Hymenobacter cellulosivorans]UOQ53974.1 hypothetical protein MUN80_04235 [Hymenobacter cellulosivorans]